MASSILTAFPILLLILFHLLLETGSVSVPTRTTQTRANMTRATSSNASNESLVKANDLKNEYTMTLAIGTPPVQITVIMDTGSDLIWTKCNSDSNFPFPAIFDPSMSSSFFKDDDESCDSFGLPGCQQNYQDGTSVKISFGRETFNAWDKEHTGVIFACGIPSKPDFAYDGIVGLGRGKLSLVSQLNLPSFGYNCAPGSNAINGFPDLNFQIMPLLEQKGKSYYYISLEGISVGETRLPITNVDFAINANGDGGMIIDSGTTFTFLERRIVDMIYDEFLNQTKLKKYDDGDQGRFGDLKNCFNLPSNVEIIPKLVFHFTGANWELPREYYIEEKDGAACLGIIANSDNETVSIFGYMQQQSMFVVYDLEKNCLLFMPSFCN